MASPPLTDDTLESLQSYVTSLLATLPDVKGKSRDGAADATDSKCKADEGSWRIERDRELADEGGLTGCREAVELLTRNQRKGAKTLFFFSNCVTDGLMIKKQFRMMLLRTGLKLLF